MNLNLSGQRTLAQGWLADFQAFEVAMTTRKALWDKLTPEKRRKWVFMAVGTRAAPKTFAHSKDPVLWIAVRVRRFLETFEIEGSEE